MEEDWSSAYHFRNFPRQKESTLCVIQNVDTAFLLCGAELSNYSSYILLVCGTCKMRKRESWFFFQLIKSFMLWKIVHYTLSKKSSWTLMKVHFSQTCFIRQIIESTWISSSYWYQTWRNRLINDKSFNHLNGDRYVFEKLQMIAEQFCVLMNGNICNFSFPHSLCSND